MLRGARAPIFFSFLLIFEPARKVFFLLRTGERSIEKGKKMTDRSFDFKLISSFTFEKREGISINEGPAKNSDPGVYHGEIYWKLFNR